LKKNDLCRRTKGNLSLSVGPNFTLISMNEEWHLLSGGSHASSCILWFYLERDFHAVMREEKSIGSVQIAVNHRKFRQFFVMACHFMSMFCFNLIRDDQRLRDSFFLRI